MQSWSQRGRLQEMTGGTKSFCQAVSRSLALPAVCETSQRIPMMTLVLIRARGVQREDQLALCFVLCAVAMEL